MSEDFSFNIQKYLQIHSQKQHEINQKIILKRQNNEQKCKNQTDKSVKQQRDEIQEFEETDSELNALKQEMEDLEGNQYIESIRRGGIVCCSNIYGIVYIAKKCDLYVLPISQIEARGDIVPVKSFTSDITQISLSSSELMISVTLDDHVDIFETKMLQQNVSD